MASGESYSPLDLHVKYKFLTSAQLGAALQILESMYQVVATLKLPGDDTEYPQLGLLSPYFMNRQTFQDIQELEDYFYRFSPFRRYRLRAAPQQQYAPPLEVESIKTERSIRIKFRPQGKYLPKVAFVKGDLKILLPRWTAAAIIVGVTVLGTSQIYDSVIGSIKLGYETEKTQIELERLRAQVEEHSLADYLLNNLREHLIGELTQSNIDEVRVYGQLLRVEREGK